MKRLIITILVPVTSVIVLASLVLFYSILESNRIFVGQYLGNKLKHTEVRKIFDEFETQSNVRLQYKFFSSKGGVQKDISKKRLRDVLIYSAGVRTEELAAAERLLPTEALWEKYKLDALVPRPLAAVGFYQGKRYMIPFGYHYSGIFYNIKLMQETGRSGLRGTRNTPDTWTQFLNACAGLKSKGITPFLIDVRDTHSAQLWFDYIIARTVGAEFRERLMNGKISYANRRVREAMFFWRDLIDYDCFELHRGSGDFTEVAAKVARGKVAMILTDSRVINYWDGIEFKQGTDYKFFPFPSMSRHGSRATVGSVGGWLVSADVRNKKRMEDFLSYVAADADTQLQWSRAVGMTLAVHPLAGETAYSDMNKRAKRIVARSDVFLLNYEQSTPSAVAEIGLSMFGEFLEEPSELHSILDEAAKKIEAEFKK